MDNNAVAPMNFSAMYQEVKKDQELAIDALRGDEEVWARFVKSPVYRLQKKFIEDLITALDEAEGRAFERGASLEEIGLRRAVNRLTRVNLLALINKVERTAEYREQRAAQSGAKNA